MYRFGMESIESCLNSSDCGPAFLVVASMFFGALVYVFVNYKAGWKSYSKSSTDSSTFLQKETRKKLRLLDKTQVSHDTAIFRFELDNPLQTLGLPVGKHIKFFCPPPPGTTWNGREDPELLRGDMIHRKYTPITGDDHKGQVCFMIKVYKNGVKKEFPDGGKMSQYLDSLVCQKSYVEVMGPVGLAEYKGLGIFTYNKKSIRVKHVGMIAGGTGITPMLQIIRFITTQRTTVGDMTEMSLLYANQTPDDILLREELDNLAKLYADQFHVWYTVDRVPQDTTTTTWTYDVGFVTATMIQARLPPPDQNPLILMCGPPQMVKFACKENLIKLGYDQSQMIAF